MSTLPFVVLGTIGIGGYYVSRRLAWAFGWNQWATLFIVVAVIALSMISMMTIMRGNYTSAISHVVSNVANVTLGVALFLFCVVVVIDAVQLFVKKEPASLVL